MHSLWHRIMHSFFPSLCLTDLSPLDWEGDTLRCPKCGKFIAYAFPLKGKYEMTISFVHSQKKEWLQRIFDTLPSRFKEKVCLSPVAEIDWELIREPVEPLLSDTWDDEEAYQACVQEYILQVRKNKTHEGKEDDNYGESE